MFVYCRLLGNHMSCFLTECLAKTIYGSGMMKLARDLRKGGARALPELTECLFDTAWSLIIWDRRSSLVGITISIGFLNRNGGQRLNSSLFLVDISTRFLLWNHHGREHLGIIKVSLRMNLISVVKKKNACIMITVIHLKLKQVVLLRRLCTYDCVRFAAL